MRVTKQDIAEMRKLCAQIVEANQKTEEIIAQKEKALRRIDYRETEKRLERGEISPDEWAKMKAEYDEIKSWVTNKSRIIAHGKESERIIWEEIDEMERECSKRHPLEKPLAFIGVILYIAGSCAIVYFLFQLAFSVK